MIRWDDDVLNVVDAAIARAAGGTPTVVLVDGDAGLGKSTLLDTIGERATGFDWLVTEAIDSAAAEPYDVLAGLGLDLKRAGGQLTPVLAAQRLRARLDTAAASGPVLVTIDDLQWADRESVDALLAVISRTSGDSLLVCVGSRPLEPGRHEAWRRWIARPGRAERIALSGLAEDTAVDWVRAQRPEISRDVARRLWLHTSGNPLYLRALVTENDAADLEHMQELPAPAEFRNRVNAQIAGASSDGCAMAHALAVLGGGWWSVRDVAAVAAVARTSPAVKSVQSTGLVETRAGTAGEQLRFTHSLVRAAINQDLPGDERQQLHARAATVVAGVGPALEHRVAAVDQYDDGLAAELDDHAISLHEQRSYRLAAHFHQLAAAVSSGPDLREQQWMESLIDLVFLGDIAAAGGQLREVRLARPTKLRELTLAIIAHWERRPRDAEAILTAQSEPEPVPLDEQSVQHRIEALLAWVRLNLGAPEPLIRQALDRAAASPGHDPMLSRLALLANAQLAARHASNPAELAAITDLPADPAAVPEQATPLLGWRGMVRANSGEFDLAVADLTEMTNRMQRGLADFSSGSYHAMLARAQWYAGDWALARVNFRLATDLGGDLPPPLAVVNAALPALGLGDLAAADVAIATARRTIESTPWTEAVDQVSIVEVTRQHVVAVPDPSLHAGLRESIEAIRHGELQKNILWCLHAGLAAVWAKAFDDATLCADRVAEAGTRTDWATSASAWLRGLMMEVAGDGKGALAALRAATTATITSMPLYAAHFHVDHARVAHLMKDTQAAARSLDLAAATYEQLGATSYLKRVDEIRRNTESIRVAQTLALSERERDVLALVTSGMSYAQIARGLFITQSTVSYHLGNIYAKANVASRHELTALAREDPWIFGLPATA